MANTLITNTVLVEPRSVYHLQTVNIIITDGIISSIASEAISPEVEESIDDLFDAEGGFCCLGWVDLRVHSGEPGFEARETLNSLALTAANGGFTHICILPDTKPTISTKQMVQYFNQAETESPVQFHPIGSITKNLDGIHLSDMMDMCDAGATLFAEISAITDSDILLKALQYSKMTNATIIDRPEDTHISRFGQMHEGETSTHLGLKGIPVLSEQLAVQRDLTLLEYAGGKLQLDCLSTSESVQLVREAKAKGLHVTASIAAHQLSFIDADLASFDTHLKVTPPFRTDAEITALSEALLDGTLDAVVSDHTPLDIESKYLEFDLATPGISGIQIAYPILNTAIHLQPGLVYKLFSEGPRSIASIPCPIVEVGIAADLTFFHPEIKTVVNEDMWTSESVNSPFLNQELTGAVLAVYNQRQLHIC